MVLKGGRAVDVIGGVVGGARFGGFGFSVVVVAIIPSEVHHGSMQQV